MMEGGGEGVVAVVRWLSDAGLEVGLLSRQRHRRALRERDSRDVKPTIQLIPAPLRQCEPRASQTFSERQHRPRSRSPDLCPDPYASTYQVAHCGADALSPAHWCSEFPPQRRRPSPALGNFEVSTDRSSSPARSDAHSCRADSDTPGIRGCQFRPQHDRDVEAFVTSLRKYPSVSERTPSAELLERLLKKAETRSAKDPQSPPSKKRRHHWDKPATIAPLNLYANRYKDHRSPHRSPHRKPDNARSEAKQKTYGPEKYPLPDGPVSVTAFDYLKSGLSRSPQTPPPKRVDKRFFMNAFREARREKKPVTAYPVCPTLQSRYEKHVKKYHPTSSKVTHVDFPSLDTCGKCKQQRPCPCETARHLRRVVDKQEQEKRQLEDTILSWLKEIPVYPNENPHDRFIRDAIVKKLAETLGGMSAVQFATEGKEEILQALSKMPMWYPSNETEREHFKDIIADNLFDRVKGIKDVKRFNQAAENILDTIKFDKDVDKEKAVEDIINELDKITLTRPEDDNTYRDLLKMKTFELLDRLPIKSIGNKYEYLNQLSDELADRLVHVITTPIDAEYEQNLSEGIHNILKDTDVRDKDKVQEKLRAVVSDIVTQYIDKDKAEDYIKTLLEGKVPYRKIDNITNEILALADNQVINQIGPEIKQMIKDAVREMLDIFATQIKNRVKVEEGLQKIVQDVATHRMDENKADVMIKSLLKGKLSQDKQGEIYNQVLSLADQIKSTQPQPIDQETKQTIKHDVHEMFEIPGVQVKNRGKVEEDLNKLIQDIAASRIDEDKADALIKSLLKGKVSEDERENITDQALALANQIKSTQSQVIDQETKQTIKHNVHEMLDLSEVPVKNRGKVEEDLNKLIQDVAASRIDEDKAETLIKSLLKGKVSEDMREDMTDQVLALANQIKSAQPQPIDQETKQTIKHDVHEMFEIPGVQVKNRGKVEEDLNKLIQDIAASRIDEDKADVLMKSLLKGKVSEDERENITNQALALVNQIKSAQPQAIDQETKQTIKHDVHETLNLSGVPIKNRGKVEEGLQKVVHDVATHRIHEDKAKALIKSILKENVSEDKHEDITDKILSLASKVKPAKVHPLNKETKQMIKEEIREILNLSGAQVKNREKVEEELQKLIENIATRGIDDHEAEAQIKSILRRKVPEEKQEEITHEVLSLASEIKSAQPQPNETQEDKHEDKILSLASRVKGTESPSIDRDTKQMITDDVREVLDLSAPIKNRGKVEKGLHKIVHDVATHRIDEDKAETLIKSILKGNVSEDKHEDITDKILSLASKVKPDNVHPLNKETKQMIKEEIREILNLSGAQVKNREKVEEELQKLIENIATRGIDDHEAEAQIKSILRRKVPEEKQEEITHEVLSLASEIKSAQPQPNETQEDKHEDKILSLASQVKGTESPSIDRDIKQMITDDVREVLDLSAPIKNRGKVEKGLHKIVHDVATHRIDEDKAETLIKSILKGNVSEDKHEDITDKILSLASKVKPDNVHPLNKETKQMIKEEIREILNLSGAQVKNREKVEEELQKLTENIATRGIDDHEAEAQIKSILRRKVPEDKQEEITHEVLSLASEIKSAQPQPKETQEDKILSLASQVKGTESQSIDRETKQIITDDVREVLDLAAPIKNRGKVEKGLHKIVHDVATHRIDEDKAETLIKSILKGNVSEDKHEDITDKILSLANKVKPTNEHPFNKETKQMIKEEIHEILNLSEAQVKNREKVEEDLQELIEKIATRGIDDHEAEAQIKSILRRKVPEDKQEEITHEVLSLASEIKSAQPQPKETQEDKILSLASQVKGTESPSIDRETKQIITDDVREVLDLSAPIRNRGKVEEGLHKIVHDVATHRINEDKAETLIKSILKGNVSEDKHEDITDKILSLACKVKPDNVHPLNKETKQMIKEEIHEILNVSGAQVKNREKVEEELQKLIEKIATRDIDNHEAEAQIKSILRTKVPEDKQEEITHEVLSLASEIKSAQPQPMDKETQQYIKRDIHDMLDLSGAQIKNRGKVEEQLQELIEEAATIGLDEDKAITQIKSLLKGKVSRDNQDDITDQILALANEVKPPQIKPLDRATKQIIKQGLSDILDRIDSLLKNRAKIEESLQKLIEDVVTQRIDEENAEAEIESILKGKISLDTQQDITDQILGLANHVKPPQYKPLGQEMKQMIKHDIHEMLDSFGAQIQNREKVEEGIEKLIQEVATRGMDESKAAVQIKSLLKGIVSADKQNYITDQILTLAHQIKRALQVIPIDRITKQMIKEDISDILDEFELNVKNRKQVEENLRTLVSDIVSKGIGEDKAKTRVKSILRGVSNDKIKDILNKVLELATKVEENQTMYIQNLEESLKNEVSYILDHTDARIRNRSKVEESLRDILSDLIMRGFDKNKAHDSIYSILKGNLSDSEAREVSRKILELAEHRSPSSSRSSSGPIASSTQNAEKIYYDQVYGIIRDWLTNLGIMLTATKLNEVAEAIANETLDRQKYLQLHPEIKISENKESEILKEQMYKALNKLIDKTSVQSIMADVDNLMRALKQIPSLQISRDSSRNLAQDSLQFVQENLEGALLDWLRGSPIYQSRDTKSKQSQERMMLKLAESLANILSSETIAKSGEKPDDALLKVIINQLKELPLEPQFKSKEYIRKLGSHLLDYLKSLQLFHDISARVSSGSSTKDSHKTKTSFMSSTNHLNELVNDWCESLPLPSTDQANIIKKDLANKIVLKIGEMNMNQDIFNDSSLYDEILQDFIDQQAKALQIGEHVNESNKKALIDQIKPFKQKVQDDFVGRAYKQKLRESISNTLPSAACPTEEDLAAFELMKENLADAFINLNYTTEDEATRAKFKRRIIDEVNKYVKDYMSRCPANPVNAKKISEDLYKALINVPLPGDESMRSEVEAVRMKDNINDWLKTIPMDKQSKAEQLHTNKLITLMAQKLRELESEFNPDFADIAVEEVISCLKKLPIKNKNNLEGMAKRLVEKIKATAESRSFIEGSRSKLMDDCLCNDLQCPPAAAPASYLSCSSFIPPCGLSKEDQQLLQRIRERSQVCETATKPRNCKDAAVNPPPLDNGSQTEMPYQNKFCQFADKSGPACSKSVALKTRPVSGRPCTTTGSQADVSPYVVVKEYYWDTCTGNKVEFATQTPVAESGRICIPSSPVSPTTMCRSRDCLAGRRPVKRSRMEGSTCRRTPRRQFASTCPNEYFSRPKPHNCLKERPTTERDYLRSQCPKCTRRKPACLSCQDNPTRICPKCFPMNVCPHPTSLYFK